MGVFQSPSLTLVRAQHHIRDLETQIHLFTREKPWAYFVDQDTEPGREAHKIRFTKPLPEILPCIVFDAANNLRAVLDQAGYAAALAGGKIIPGKPRARTNFPFADTLSNLDNHIDSRGACDDLPTEITAIFREFNPYKGGNDPLWALNQLCNTKKHCSLVPIQIGGGEVFLTGRLSGPGWFSEITGPGHLGWNPEKNEITLMITSQTGAKADITANIYPTVAIGGIETLSGKPAVTVLDGMADIVERVLLATEAECRRLGFKLG
jgi:hypothetical protein